MPRFHITIHSSDREHLRDLVRVHKLQVFEHGIQRDDAGYTVHAMAQPAEIAALRAAGYQVEQHEDLDEHGRARQQEVGKGNRYLRPPNKH